MDFNKLPIIINGLHCVAQNKALQGVNRMLAERNWLIGYYIVEYEQNGQDRAQYGVHLMENLAAELRKKRLKGMSQTNLKLFRAFFLSYPQIRRTLSDEFKLLPESGKYLSDSFKKSDITNTNSINRPQ